MTEDELKERFKAFSIRIINMVDSMPNTISGRAIASQVVRSGTSPSANYRAACIGKSGKDFINKLKMVEEELDETGHWIDIIKSTGMLPENRMKELYQESQELLKITTSSILTMKQRLGGDNGSLQNKS